MSMSEIHEWSRHGFAGCIVFPNLLEVAMLPTLFSSELEDGTAVPHNFVPLKIPSHNTILTSDQFTNRQYSTRSKCSKAIKMVREAFPVHKSLYLEKSPCKMLR